MISKPEEKYDVAVFVGRFQLLHKGHIALIEKSLSMAPICVVVIGSSHQARSPKNPFSWEERSEMIRLSLSDSDRTRVLFLPVRDYYDEKRWSEAVQKGVQKLLLENVSRAFADRDRVDNITLVGHFKDATSEYLKAFPGWHLESVKEPVSDGLMALGATYLRDAYFGCGGENLDATLGVLRTSISKGTRDFLRAWAMGPIFGWVSEEWKFLQQYKRIWAGSPFPPFFVTSDAVVRCGDHVLLTRRGQAPGKGLYALPGGFVEARETIYQAILRELGEETGLDVYKDSMCHYLKSSVVFDHPDRSLRGRTVTHAHYFELPSSSQLPEVRAGDDAAKVEWVEIRRLQSLECRFFEDHFHILDHFLNLTV